MIDPPALSNRLMAQLDRAALLMATPFRWIGWSLPDPGAARERLAPPLWQPCVAIAVMTALLAGVLVWTWQGIWESAWHVTLLVMIGWSGGWIGTFRMRHPILGKPDWDRDERERLIAQRCRTATLATLAVTLGVALFGCLILLIADLGRPVGPELIWRVAALGLYAQFVTTITPMVVMSLHDRALRDTEETAPV